MCLLNYCFCAMFCVTLVYSVVMTLSFLSFKVDLYACVLLKLRTTLYLEVRLPECHFCLHSCSPFSVTQFVSR